ncbi:protein IMPACT-A-like [Atheta coriaria]|uniref:protein IMPACT-A-like n=1 Tax=Dalotia coriaria TaxID=877792 RepID=UPI0031F369C8
MENCKLQEEQEVLSSIYADEWKKEIDGENSYSIQINPDVKLYVTLNDSYPSEGPPIYSLLAPTLSKYLKHKIAEEFDTLYLDNLGEPVLFQWIEKLKELVNDGINESTEVLNHSLENDINEAATDNSRRCDIRIIHGPVIMDRKSSFQGHTCDVSSAEDIKNALNTLLENKKISQATHNIYAYIVKQSNGTILQDCDDDGETHAGGRLLHLLQILKVENVMVVVSRWYGGIHLGPDRFRHINNAARQAA